MNDERIQNHTGTVNTIEEVPEGAIPLFTNTAGETAYINNVPNPYVPNSDSIAKSDTEPIYKSVREHRHIKTLAEARAFTKMESRPHAGYSGSARPDLYSIEKSMAESDRPEGVKKVKWDKGMDPALAVEQDWKDYEMFCRSHRN